MLYSETREKTSVSRLVMSRLTQDDSGPYTCSPAGSDNDTVIISVSAMSSGNQHHHSSKLLLLLFVLMGVFGVLYEIISKGLPNVQTLRFLDLSL